MTSIQGVAVQANNVYTNVFIIVDPNTKLDILSQIQDSFLVDKSRVTVDASRHEFVQNELNKLTRELERYSRLLGEDALSASLMPNDFSALLVWKKKIESYFNEARRKAFNVDSLSKVPVLSLNSRVFLCSNRSGNGYDDLLGRARFMARIDSKFNAVNKSERVPVLYFSRDIATLMFEMDAIMDFASMKATVIEVSVILDRVVDLTDPITQAMLGVESFDFIRPPDPKVKSRVQQLGSAISAAGFQGAIYPSWARFGGSNLVVFAGNIANASSLSVTNKVALS